MPAYPALNQEIFLYLSQPHISSICSKDKAGKKYNYEPAACRATIKKITQ